MANFEGHPQFDFEIPSFAYTLITDPEQVAAELARIGNQPTLAFDFESTGVDYVTNQPVGISLADEAHAWYFHGEGVLEQITPWLVDQMEVLKTPFIGHHIKFDMHLLRKLGVRLENPVDTMVAQWLVNENSSLALKTLAKFNLGIKEELAGFRDLLKYTKGVVGKKRMDEVSILEIPFDILGPYAALDARLAYDLWNYLIPELKNEDQWNHFHEMQMPFTKVLMNMEARGVRIDHKAASSVKERYEALRQEAEEEWNERTEEIMGEPVNPRSPKQLQELLYDNLRLVTTRTTKSGAMSTDELTLLRLKTQDKSGLVEVLLKYRKYNKMIDTYLGALLNKTHNDRIHTNFNQTGTVTGRLSSSGDINLQNQPSRGEYGKDIRSCFIASEGHDLVGIDYSQIELRILAHFSRDEHLVKAYLWGADVHQMTADRLGGVPRYLGKATNFGKVYGQGPVTLADVLEKDGHPRPTKSQAQKWLEDYDRMYPGIPKWIRFELIKARENNYVETLAGRRRHVEGLHHHDKWQRARAERQAINSIIQGSAGDAINTAMLWAAEIAPEYEAHMLLQVHDELLFEVPGDNSKAFAEVIQQKMEDVREHFNISVPIIAEPNIGPNWSEAKD